MRLIGPASMGIIVTRRREQHDAGVVRPGARPAGPGGGLAAVRPARHRRCSSWPTGCGIGISSFVSLGNKADVSANDFLNYWDDDPDTDVVLLYTESFGNPRKFGRIARRVSRRKPIVAVKSGRGLPDDVAADALYQQAGVIRVDTVRQLFDVGRVLDGQPLPAGRRVAVVANADSPAVLALDALRAARLEPAALAPATCRRRRARHRRRRPSGRPST